MSEGNVRYPGIPSAMDGTGAIVAMETAGGEAAGAYPITPASNMGEGWALAVARGERNVFGRRLLFFEPEGEHAAAGVTAGMSMTGLRAANFSASQGLAYMHESLYAAVGKRLTYVLNVACRAMTKQSLNIHCAHDDYHAVDDAGFFQLFARDVQACADLNLIAHRIAEQALNPGICAQDGFLTSHVIETLNLPERELVKEYLGDPNDIVPCPTPAQRLMFGGDTRRRVPELFDYDNPAQLGTVQNQDSYAQGVAAQRPFFFDHIAAITDEAMAAYTELTGRPYARAMGYLVEDADYLIVAQGSLVANAEAVADYLRAERDLKVGVVNMVMFRPFPADLVVELLRGKKAVTVLERVDQPLAIEPPVLREVRTAMSQAVENGRSGDDRPYPALGELKPNEVPLFFSGCSGLGSRDIQPGDIIAAVENMVVGGPRKRQFYLGIEFVRDNPIGGQKRIQDQLVASYPHLPSLAIKGDPSIVIKPKGSLTTRIHSIGGWGAITMGKNITKMLFDLLGLHVKSNPKYGSEKKGMPTTFFAAFAHETIRLNCDLKHVDVVLSPDANVFSHSNPLAGLDKDGVFVVQSADAPEVMWKTLPRWAQKLIVDKGIKLFCIDAFKIAREEATDSDLQFRMQGNAFMGAFFRTSPLMAREGVDEGNLFEAIRKQLHKTFGHRGARIVEDNFRVIRRGYEEVHEVTPGELNEHVAGNGKSLAWYLKPHKGDGGIADQERFFDETSQVYLQGSDPISDPFVALSAVPAATGVFRDMTAIRFEVPEFIAENCTGCGDCWTQCPDVAIPGLVSDIDAVLATAVKKVQGNTPMVELPGLVRDLAEAARAQLAEHEFDGFAGPLAAAYEKLLGGLDLDGGRRKTLDAEFQQVLSRVRELPLTKVTPFFDGPETREPGSGGLLSINVNPNTCKGCMLCVDVCNDDALRPIVQTDEVIEQLRDNWDFYQSMPDTPDRFVQVRDWERGIGVLSSMLLKRDAYHAIVGGDGACMGCGEKTVLHLTLTAVEAALQPRVAKFVDRIDRLIEGLETRARLLLTRGTTLDSIPTDGKAVGLSLDETGNAELQRIKTLAAELRDLKWRYTEGPTGRGRAALGMTNSTGCSSVWGGTYPYNPYPYPWTNHLFQDAPSVAIGIFEGHMRKMADCFASVRRAEMVVEGKWTAEADEELNGDFDYREFTDEEFLLCPPVIATGGDGAMFDIGFQNLSRLLASGKPLRVIVLDTQVYSNTGGQACTSGFFGQAADMSPYGKAQHGKEEMRKELSFISMAHRGAFVMQSSQASAAHLIGGVLRGLSARRPSIFVLHSPCMPEHGISDSAAARAAKMSLESRAFPHFIYDPDAGGTMADRLDLTGNPAPDSLWPTYTLEYIDSNDEPATMELPVTVADWAASETRFRKHFRQARDHSPNQVPFHEFLTLSEDEREGKVAFIHAIDRDRRLMRVVCSREIVELADDRLDFYSTLRQMAGLEVSAGVRDQVSDELRDELEGKLASLRAEYEAKLAELEASYPQMVAGRIAEVLMGAGADGDVMSALSSASLPPVRSAIGAPVSSPAASASASESGDDDELMAEPAYVNKALCTACDECTNLNPKIFAYDDNKKAFVKNPTGGPFKDIVLAAERCPASCIAPGEPQNPNERDLDQWVERAAPFN